MGLDQYFTIENRIITQEQISEYDNYNSKLHEKDLAEFYLRKINKYKSIREYINKIYDKDKSLMRNYHKIEFIESFMTELIDDCTLQNMKTAKADNDKRDILLLLATKQIRKFKETIKNFESIKAPLIRELDDEEFWYFRKHHDLNAFMYEMYRNRVKHGDFNGEYLVVLRQDLEMLDKKANEEHWTEVSELVESALKIIDFSRQTLMYSCSY